MKLNNVILSIIIFLSLVNILNAQTTKWRVIWEANPDSENVDYYAIYKGTNESFNSMDSIGRVNHPNTEFVDSLGLNLGQMYYYRVVAVNDTNAKSLPSDAANAAIPKILLSDSLKFIKSISDTIAKDSVISDPDHDMFQDSLTWTMNGSSQYNDGTLSIAFAPLYDAIFTTTQNWQGPVTVDFRVTDADSFFDIKSVSILLKTIIVSGDTLDDSIINKDIQDISIVKGDTIPSIDLDYYIDSSVHDTSEIVWTWAYESGELLLTVNINNSTHVANISVLSISDSVGTETLRFLATKIDSSYDFDLMTISISEPGNHNPQFTSNPNTTVIEDSLYTYTVTASDSDSDVLTFELINNSPLFLNIASLNDTAGLISGIPSINDVGQNNVTIRVTDGNGGEDNQAYILTVIPNNRLPYFTSNPDTTARVGEAYLYFVSAHDPDDDPLTFQLIGNSPTFLETDTLSDSTANILGVPDSNDVGEHVVTIRVTDSNGGDLTQVYELTVVLPPPIELVEGYKAYPNPWVESETQFKRIFFENFPVGSNLLVYNLLGEPVLNTKIDNSLFLWNVKNNSGLNVQSGLYFYYVKDGSKILSSGKIVIIR